MALVLIETGEGSVKKSSFDAIAYAHALGAGVAAVAIGELSDDAIASLGNFGVNKLFQVAASEGTDPTQEMYVQALYEVAEKEGEALVIVAHSLVGAAVAGRLAVRMSAAFASNVAGLPNTDEGFVVRRSIYTGKAFVSVKLETEKKVLAVKKNAAELVETSGTAEVVAFAVTFAHKDGGIQSKSKSQATGDLLLSDAERVVSAGRGMKGPEHWGIIEDLAKALHAATGCSKPVSDMEWRPHHEHVGQTGLKVAPQLYIAVGISGAIQHLAGVNGSKCIVVINKDPEAPFFKAADYGIVGDAFEVVPKLTQAFIAAQS